MATPNLSEIITTTQRNRSGKLADNMTANNALLMRLKEKGKVRPVAGGRSIVQELEYAENSTFKRYSGYEALDISPSEVFTAAEFDWKQAAVAVSISGLESDIQNTGKEQVIDLLESRIANAERTMVNNLSADCYSDGTADSGKQMGGLQLLIADNPAVGTVGGIDRATWDFWRNFSYDASTDGGAAATKDNIQSYMNHVYLKTSRNTDHPDLIVSDDNYFKLYWESLQQIQRITNTKMAEAGFQNLKFMGADVVFDGGIDGNCPANHMYFLNCNYIHYRPHKNRNMVPLGDKRFSTNQDAEVNLLGWAGNMTVSNPRLQAVLKD